MPLSSSLHTPALMEEPELFSVPGVEVFSAGKWNGREITSKDLDDIVEAYSSTRSTIRPFLKLGHSDEQTMLIQEGLPAAGWIENVRRHGSKIVADFVDIPKKIYQLLRSKAYRKVSAEIYRNVEIEGKTYPKLLGAVALLGAEMPAVMNLADIMSRYKHAGGENFAFDLPSAILFERNTTQQQPEGETMTPEEIAALKADIEKYKNLADANAAEVTKKETELANARKVAKDAQVEKFVSELKAENLCTKAMEPFVKALVGEPVEKYSIEGKEMSREDLVKQVIKFAAEAGKVNFKDTTSTGGKKGDEPKTKMDEIKAEIETYAAKHNVSWDAAYRHVTRNLDLPAKRMTESGDDE